MPCPLCNDRGMVEMPHGSYENGFWENCPMCYPPEPKKPGLMRRFVRWFKARFRLDLDLVCELSKGRGPHDDFHDYPDDEHGQPWHMIPLKCKRCGKEFYI